MYVYVNFINSECGKRITLSCFICTATSCRTVHIISCIYVLCGFEIIFTVQDKIYNRIPYRRCMVQTQWNLSPTVSVFGSDAISWMYIEEKMKMLTYDSKNSVFVSTVLGLKYWGIPTDLFEAFRLVSDQCSPRNLGLSNSISWSSAAAMRYFHVFCTYIRYDLSYLCTSGSIPIVQTSTPIALHHLTSPHITSYHHQITSFHLTYPHITWHHLTSPHSSNCPKEAVREVKHLSITIGTII